MDRESKLRLGTGMLILLLVGLFTRLAGSALADLSNQPTPVSIPPALS